MFDLLPDVRALDLTGRVFTQGEVTFHIFRCTKSNSKTVSYSAFPDVPKLCVVRAMKAYESVTDLCPQGKRQLLIALTKPHKAFFPQLLPDGSDVLCKKLVLIILSLGLIL